MAELQWIAAFVAGNIWHIWPAFLISVVLSVLIRALKLDRVIRSALSRRVGLAVLLATGVGAFSPFCSCTVVPVVSGLLLSGVPLAPVMAFWIASPLMDLEIFALSVGTLGMPLAVARLLATLLLSLGGGYLTLALTRAGFFAQVLRPSRRARPVATTQSPAAPRTSPPISASGVYLPLTLSVGPTLSLTGASGSAPLSVPTPVERWWRPLIGSLRALDVRAAGRDVAALSWSLGRWLVLAFVLEALIVRYVPQQSIATVLGGRSVLAVPLAALIGIPMYLGNLSALPIVAGLLTQGMQPGAAIAFLIAGPITTVPAMTAVWNIVERRVFWLYLAIGLLGAILAGFVTNLVLG